ncbi:MAG: hypothetical protein E6G82_09470 [Alphaproteobacteria bacterium]|nr:MAG: hypothetical protein E6G82_09470 [Alphaproteobacteria bacterium]
MAHNFAINTDVHHQLQGPQGRAVIKEVYQTIRFRLLFQAKWRKRLAFEQSICLVDRAQTGSRSQDIAEIGSSSREVVRAHRAFAHLGEVK